MKIEAKLLPTQLGVLTCEAKHILVTGGIGSGKTATGAHWILKQATTYPEATGLICSNTYKQLQNATVAALRTELLRLGLIEGTHWTITDRKITIGHAEILLYSLENYETMFGINVGYAWIDEAAFTKHEAYVAVKERVRDPKGPCQLLLTTTTNGFNWLYDTFVTGANSNHITYKMLTKDNHFLESNYYQGLLHQYGGSDTLLARQQLFGEFVNITAGQVYSSFDESLHVHTIRPSGGIKYVGVDFNIGNMSALVCELYDDEVHVLDEIKLTGNANTYDMATELRTRYGTRNVVIIPDSTGKARKTSSSTTDHAILRGHGFTLNAPTRNPLIEERQKELNHCFLMGKVTINPKCKHLISELHKLTHEDEEGKVAHLSVALGYIIHRYNIAKLRSGGRKFKQIQL